MTSSPGSMKAMKALSMPISMFRKPAAILAISPSPHPGQLTLVGSRRNGYFSFGVNLASPIGRVGVGNGLLQPGPALGGRVLVAFHPVERIFGCVEDELGRVVSEKALSHVDDGLFGRRRSRLVDDGPGPLSSQQLASQSSIWLCCLQAPNLYAPTCTHAQLTTHPASGPRPAPRALASDCHSWRNKF